MARPSRTSKYEELRSRMQNDAETQVTSRDLNQFEQRLNQINPRNFSAPSQNDSSSAEDHDPIHARRKYQPETQTADTNKPAGVSENKDADQDADFNSAFLRQNENYTTSFNNEYLNEYIKEAKQYNIDHGNAFSTNTDLNILKSLKDQAPAGEKPYPDEYNDHGDTADIPFLSSSRTKQQPAEKQSDFVEDDNETQTMSRDDIAAEVQNLIRGQNSQNQNQSRTASEPSIMQTKPSVTDTHEALLNETNRLSAHVDDIDDSVSEVSSKVDRTSHLMNMVLIVLIIALAVVLAVVIYWVLSSRGV